MQAGWSLPRRARWALLIAALLQVLGAIAEPIVHAGAPAPAGVTTGLEVETEKDEPSETAAEPGCGCFLCRAPGTAACLSQTAELFAVGAPAPAPLTSSVPLSPVTPLTGYLSRGPPII